MQTATVLGCNSTSTDVEVDRYGRVKVQFAWDANAPQYQVWVRVAQSWAGKSYGSFFWPRPGHEVVVAFTDGDPDQPLIVGSVYNEVNQVPFTLPDYRLTSGFRTQSYGGSTTTDFNGLVFSDVNGSEVCQFQAQKAYYANIETDKYEHVFGHETHVVGNLGAVSLIGASASVWGSAFADKAKSLLASFYPGHLQFTVGLKQDVVFAYAGGSRTACINGSDVRFLYDTFTARRLALGKAGILPKKTRSGRGVAGSRLWSQLFGGMNGLNDHVVMTFNRFIYGQRTSVQRGLSLNVHAGEGSSTGTKLVWVERFAKLSVLVSAAGNILAAVFPSKAKEYVEISGIKGMAGGVSGKLLAIWQFLETNDAVARARHDKLSELRFLLKRWESMTPAQEEDAPGAQLKLAIVAEVESGNVEEPMVLPAKKSFRDLRVHWQQAVKGHILAIKERYRWLDSNGLHDATKFKRLNEVTQGSYQLADSLYSIGAKEITLLARPNDADKPPHTRSLINVYASGADADGGCGLLALGGSRMCSLESGDSVIHVLGETTQQEQGVVVGTSDEGTIELVQGKKGIGTSVTCSKAELEIDGGRDAPVTISTKKKVVVHGFEEVELKAGSGGGGSIKITQQGVKISGVTIELDATTSFKMNATVAQLRRLLDDAKAMLIQLDQGQPQQQAPEPEAPIMVKSIRLPDDFVPGGDE